MSWVEARLDEVAEVKLGRQRSPKNHFGSRMRPYLRAANVTWSGLDLSDVKEMNFTEEESAVFELRPGDVLVAEASGSPSEVGKPAIWHGEIPACCFQNTLLRVRSRGPLPEYLLYVLRPTRDPADSAMPRAGLGSIISAPHGCRPGLFQSPLWRNSGGTDSQIYGSSAKADGDQDSVPILRMGNIQAGRLDFTDLKYLPSDHPDVEKCLLRPGDVLFNRTNSPELVGKSAVFKTGPDPIIFASYLIRVRLTPECDPAWAALAINSPAGRRYVASVRTQQVGQANVNGTKLASMPIPLPPLEEQRRIVAEVERQLSLVDSLAVAIEQALARSAALRRAILELAFTGRLVAQDPSDEPASALLDRIRAARVTVPRAGTRRPRRQPAK